MSTAVPRSFRPPLLPQQATAATVAVALSPQTLPLPSPGFLRQLHKTRADAIRRRYADERATLWQRWAGAPAEQQMTVRGDIVVLDAWELNELAALERYRDSQICAWNRELLCS